MLSSTKHLGDIAQVPPRKIDLVNAVQEAAPAHGGICTIALAVVRVGAPAWEVGAPMKSGEKDAANSFLLQERLNLPRPRVESHVAPDERNEIAGPYLGHQLLDSVDRMRERLFDKEVNAMGRDIERLFRVEVCGRRYAGKIGFPRQTFLQLRETDGETDATCLPTAIRIRLHESQGIESEQL